MSDSQIKAQMDVWVQDGTLPNDIQAVSNTTLQSVGKNLFDKSAVTKNTYIPHGSGVITSLNDFNSSDYIPVKGNTNYRASGETQQGAYYDANKSYISGFNNTTDILLTPTNARYIRWTINNSNLNTATRTRQQPHTSLQECYTDIHAWTII